ncbi:MAG: hypothetical protein HY919_04140 [Elusimicrobia bacterium]|nr:hypothetical protein [Elusimicrobiota bacterium]
MRIKNIIEILILPIRIIYFNVLGLVLFVRCLLPHIKVKKGDKFLVLEDTKGDAEIHYNAPCTDGFKCIIPKGTILVAYYDPPRLTAGFGCIPENKDEFEKRYVPQDVRMSPKYAGYSFGIKYSDIGKKIKKIE